MPDTPPRENPETSELERPLPTASPLPVFQVQPGVPPAIDLGTSSSQVAYFAAAATLLPFLQALGTAVGTRIGERLDDATRGALRRILRRELERSTSRTSDPSGISGISLATPGGTRIRLDADTPAEALPQLLTMRFERLEEQGSDAPGLVRWTQEGWLATIARSGQLCDLTWDPGRTTWVADSTPPEP